MSRRDTPTRSNRPQRFVCVCVRQGCIQVARKCMRLTTAAVTHSVGRMCPGMAVADGVGANREQGSSRRTSTRDKRAESSVTLGIVTHARHERRTARARWSSRTALDAHADATVSASTATQCSAIRGSRTARHPAIDCWLPTVGPTDAAAR
jgi:hypothetical protein